LALVQNEPWRGPTGFRYLEKLKEDCIGLEKSMLNSHAEASQAYYRLTRSKGLLEYKKWRDVIDENSEYLNDASEELMKFKEHISRVFSGDVRSDVLELEEAVEKLNTEKRHQEADLKEVTDQMRSETVPARRDWFSAKKEDLKESIRNA